MHATTDSKPKADVRDYLAAERTFLAWVRTGLALMGFGFVVARFGLFVQQLEVFQHAAPGSTTGLSLWFGTALIAVGVVVQVSSAWRHVRLVRQLDRGEPSCARSLTQAVATAIFLALVGLAMAIYLLSVRHSALHGQVRKENVIAQVTKGIIDKRSNHSVDQTVEKIKSLLQAKGVNLLGLVDHSGEAEKVGMKMRSTKLLTFGNLKAGTPLMLASPTRRHRLAPQAFGLVRRSGKDQISFNSPDYLKDRHNLPTNLLPNIALVETWPPTEPVVLPTLGLPTERKCVVKKPGRLALQSALTLVATYCPLP
jgi:putative membrane protein